MDEETRHELGSTKKKWYASGRWWIIGAVVVVLIAVAIGVVVSQHSSSSSTAQIVATTAPAEAAVGSGYLADETDGVIFIQWTDTNNYLSGTAQVETPDGTPPNQSVSTNTISVTGQLNDSTITLSFDDGNQVFGTLSSGSFTVNFPQQDGSLIPVTFHSATVSQFNQALAALHGTTGSVDSKAAAAETVTSERQAIDKAANAVSSDISNLSSDSSQLTGTLSSFKQGLAQAQSDLTTEAQLEQQVVTESHNGTDPDQVCSDADSVASDEDTVASDGDGVSSDADSTEGAASTSRSDITNLQGAFSALRSAQAQQPSYSDGAPTQSAVNQVISGAQTALKSAINTANADLSQVNGYESQAYQDAQAASNAGNCAGPASPATQPTIA